MAADKTIKEILKATEKAVADFQGKVPDIQRAVLDGIIGELKELDVNGDRVLNSVQNLKLISGIKNKIERLIVTEGYKADVKKFVEAFDVVAALQSKYFADFNLKFKPSKTLPIIREMAVDKTLNDLLGQGLEANILDRVQDILNQNITTGGSYASMTEQLRNHILTNDTGEGSLERYSKTITTDAINQYAAQYHDALAQDLNFNWGRYVGSNIETTREFCDRLTAKEWVHRSELPEVLRGVIDGQQCKLSKSTGLPLGMIPGTDVNNFKIRRGGYNCGHQFFWVPDVAVPVNVKQAFANPPAPQKQEPSNPFVDKKQLEGYPQTTHETSLTKLKAKTHFVLNNHDGTYYDPSINTVKITQNKRFQDSEYHQKTVLNHELGHAIHSQNNIITPTHVDKKFKTLFDNLKDIAIGKAFDMHESIMELVQKALAGNTELAGKYGFAGNKDLLEGVGVVADILGSLTDGRYGGGHSVKYYKSNNGAQAEIFAHGNSLHFTDNKIMDEIMPDIKKMIAEYFKELYGQ